MLRARHWPFRVTSWHGLGRNKFGLERREWPKAVI